MSILPIGRKREIEASFLPLILDFSMKVKNCLDIFQREREIMRSISVRPGYELNYCFFFFFFYGSMEIWIQKFRRNYTFRELWILEECKVLFKRNIVIFSRNWSHRITILLFFFVPGKGSLDTFYRRDENRFMVSRWKFSSSTFISSRLGYKKKKSL